MRAAAIVATLIAAAGPARPARADDGPTYVGRAPHEVVVEGAGERSTKNLVIVGAIAGAGVLFGAIGVGFNLAASSNANAVSQSGPSGLTWSTADQGKVDAARTDSIATGVFYGLGGAALLVAAVYYVVTEPPPQRIVIQTGEHHARAVPIVVPTGGGALAGAVWRF
jgi:hypothetical protein